MSLGGYDDDLEHRRRRRDKEDVFMSEFSSFATEKFDATKSKPVPIEDAQEETEACWCLPIVPVRRKQDEREEDRVESSCRQLANEGLVLTTT